MNVLRPLLILLVLTIGVARGAPVRPTLVASPLTPTVLRAFQRFELHLRPGRYANPFDATQIQVTGHFLSPSGRQIAADGFYYQDFTRALVDRREVLTPRGAPEWRVRFTPTEIGTWAYTVAARDPSGERTTVQKTFRVLPPLEGVRGFVRTQGDYFICTDGRPYFPVGENLAWPGSEGTYAYDIWLRQLGRQKANWARIWLGPHRAGPDTLTLQSQRARFNLEAAWRLDQILSLAERTDVRLCLCAESFNALRIRPGPALWGENPLNRARGGYLARPAEFFTDPRARQAFRDRLRYMAARWGYSPNVFSWELMNEVDLTEEFNVARVREWVSDVAAALRGFDPYAHPIGVSFGGAEGEPSIDALPQIDYAQTHLYGAGDIAQALREQMRFKSRRYAKPVLVSEVGASVHRASNERDSEGVWLHDALWAPVFVGAAGTGMPWWWDSYVDAGQRYDAFGAVERFVRDVPWTSYTWNAPTVVSVRYSEPQRLARNDVLIAPPQAGWQIAPYNKPVEAEVLGDGTVRNGSMLSRMLHGAARPDLYNPTSFLVNYPVDGDFVIHLIDPPTSGAVLRVWVDGRPALEEPFASGELATPSRRAVNVSAGQHVVRVDNSGAGWIDVNYELPGYRRSERPNVRISGLCGGRYGLVWIENRDHSWLRRVLHKAVRPVPPTTTVLGGFDIGDYVIEEWNTQTGTSIPLEARCVDGYITLRARAIASDIAYKIRPR